MVHNVLSPSVSAARAAAGTACSGTLPRDTSSFIAPPSPGYSSNPANDQKIRTYGVAWKPLAQIVFKADWQDVSNRAGTGVDQFNLLMGFVY